MLSNNQKLLFTVVSQLTVVVVSVVNGSKVWAEVELVPVLEGGGFCHGRAPYLWPGHRFFLLR
jgi:hypothetical protein